MAKKLILYWHNQNKRSVYVIVFLLALIVKKPIRSKRFPLERVLERKPFIHANHSIILLLSYLIIKFVLWILVMLNKSFYSSLFYN